jgi:hypothetical protein
MHIHACRFKSGTLAGTVPVRSYKAFVVVLLTSVAACGTADVYNGAGSAESLTTTGGSTGSVTTGGSGATTGTVTGTTTGGDQNQNPNSGMGANGIPSNAFFHKNGGSITLILSSRSDLCTVLQDANNETIPASSVDITLEGNPQGNGNVNLASAVEDTFDANCNDTRDSNLKPATLSYQGNGGAVINGNVSVTFANGSNPNATFQATDCPAIGSSSGLLQSLLGHGKCNTGNKGGTATTTTGGTSTTTTTGGTATTTTTGGTTTTTTGGGTSTTTGGTSTTTGGTSTTTGGTTTDGGTNGGATG